MKKIALDISVLILIYWLANLSGDYLKVRFEAGLLARSIVCGLLGVLIFLSYKAIYRRFN